MAGGVLALDLATRTGWACGRLLARPLTPMEAQLACPPKPASGTLRFQGATVGAFMADAHDRLADLLSLYRPAGLIYEKPILPDRTTPETVLKLNGLAALASMLAHRAGIRWVRTAQPSKVKRHFCSSGAAGKAGVLAACTARGWTGLASDDEADALALLDYAAHLAVLERAGAPPLTVLERAAAPPRAVGARA